MLPTPRLYLALLLTVPLIAFGGSFASAGVLLALILVLAGVADGVVAGLDLRRVAVEREVEDKLSIGAWNPVRLRIRNASGRRLPGLVLRDLVPLDFGVEPPAGVRLDVPPVASGATAEIGYRVHPRHRGDFTFGDVHLRLLGPLGLAQRQASVRGTARAVRVYPNLRDLRKYDLMARRGLQMEAGTRAIRQAGASTEFERLREYVPDDEYRRINWKATARRGKPIVNELQTERSQNLVVMIDAGRLMAARADAAPATDADAVTADETSVGLTKLDHALNAGLLLGYVAALRGDRVAVLGYADSVRAWVPPTRGRRAFVAMVQAFYKLASEPVEADHGLAFDFLSARNPRRSLIVLFTDLADRESSRSLVARVSNAARHHQVVVVTLGDPNVSRPATAVPRSADDLYAKLVAQRLLDERTTVLGYLGQRGVWTVDTDADHLSPRVVSAYLELKQRGRI